MKSYSYYLETLGEIGVAEEINHPIVHAKGLPLAHLNEIVVFETGELGEVFNINKDTLDILTFSKSPIRVNTKITRTNSTLSIPLGNDLLGTIIDPLAQPLNSDIIFPEFNEQREIDIQPLGIMERERIKQPLRTGVTIVDMMVPLGKGQKELILGDRKTGKSLFLLSAIKTQIKEGSIAIYAAIGKKKSDIKQLDEFFKQEGLSNKVVVVATSPYDSPSLIYLTPYTAMTVAEYFRDQGIDVLLVMDDLSTHAKFYRELSLIAKRFPGRDSYPGDIFYTHARLLERAGNFKNKKVGETSITCFPVAETIEGDFTGYIVTNLMGITDGHIFFDSNIYRRGIRPAINIGLSVTRVGRQTQLAVKRHITRELISFLSVYEKMQTYSHFGAELTDTVKGILKTGDKIYKFFDQPYSLSIPEEVQLILFTMLWFKLIEEDISVWLDPYRINLTRAMTNDESIHQFFSTLLKVETFNELLSNVSKNKNKIISICNNIN